MSQQPPEAPKKSKPFFKRRWVQQALIGGAIAVLVAIISGIFALLTKPQTQTPPSPTVTQTQINTTATVLAQATATAQAQATATATAQPLCSDNLITCSNVVPIYEPGKSSVTVYSARDSTLHFTFNNTQTGTALALQLAPSLNVASFRHVEIKGTSTTPFSFLLEYKVKMSSGGLKTVSTSASQSFLARPGLQTVSVLIGYAGSVDEVDINFYKQGQSSDVSISSIRLI